MRNSMVVASLVVLVWSAPALASDIVPAPDSVTTAPATNGASAAPGGSQTQPGVTQPNALPGAGAQLGPQCDPNYGGVCVPIATDVDCAGGPGNGPAFVRGPVSVIGTDIYGLDADHDGIGCE
ncbi:hypothetical protein R8Z50_32685 [Longispora sp. K20-0274]|uniref:hypothetical protein n=1 Tax=Longispora sp. K20-0274 TaxID=3088255 RepID=UPI00399A2FC3